MSNGENISIPKQFGKNREKLNKIETKISNREFKVSNSVLLNSNKMIPMENLEENGNISSRQNSKFYNKFEREIEENRSRNIVENLITNNIITNNISNILNKQQLFSWLGIPTKYDEMNSYSKWWKFYDSMITICNFLVMIFAIYDYELNYSYPRKIVNDYNTIRILMILLSLTALFCVLKRHYNKSKWRNVNITRNKYTLKSYKYGKHEDSDEEDDFFYNEETTITGKKRKFFKKGLFVDICINLMIPYPHIDFIINFWEVDRDINDYIRIQYLLSDFLYIMVILRTFYLIRSTINYSIFTDHFANTLARERGVKCNVRFALKCILKTEHFKIVLVFLIASVIILGFALRVFERPYWSAKGRIEFEYLSNSFWLTFVTMLTIGYGDISPFTTCGRAITVISAIWGTFICALFVVCIYGLFDLSNDQFLVFIKIVKSRSALKFIEDSYCFRKAKMLKKKDPSRVRENYNKMFDSFNEFKNMRNESKSIYRSNGLLYYNIKLFNQMKKFNQRFDKVEIDLETLINYDFEKGSKKE